jgi:hypothetical protein
MREDDQDMTAVVNGKRSTTLPVMMSVSVQGCEWSGAVDRSFLWQRGVCILLALFLADGRSFSGFVHTAYNIH